MSMLSVSSIVMLIAFTGSALHEMGMATGLKSDLPEMAAIRSAFS